MRLLPTILIVLLISSPMAFTGFSGAVPQLTVLTTDVCVNESASLLVAVLDANGEYVSGIASGISISILRGSDHLVLDATPVEVFLQGTSYYECDFTADHMGQYMVYTTYGSLAGAGTFVAKFDMPKNMTEQQVQTEVVLNQEHDERMSMLKQSLYKMSALEASIMNFSQKQHAFSLVDSLQSTVLDSTIQVIFYALMFMAVFVVASTILTRKNEREKIFEEFERTPIAIQIAKGAAKEVQKEQQAHRKPYERKPHS